MRILTLSLAALVWLAPSVESVGTLKISVDDNKLVPEYWYYNEISSRPWVPSCYWYSWFSCLMLAECDWYPAEFQSTYRPEYDDGTSTYAFEVNWGPWRALCGADLDEWNVISFQYNQGAYYGSFRVIPGGDSDEVYIQCSLVAEDDGGSYFQCDDAAIAWDNQGTFTINIAVV